MSQGSTKLVIFLVLVGGSLALTAIKYAMRSSKGKSADRALECGDLESAIKAYRNQLLGVLELGPGSMNENNPHIFLSDANEGQIILGKIEEACKRAGQPFDPSSYDALIERVEALVENPASFGLTGKLKGEAKREFQAIRKELTRYIKDGMPANYVAERPRSVPLVQPIQPIQLVQQKVPRNWSLTLFLSGEKIATHDLKPGTYLLGRQDGAHFKVDDPAVSRRHLEIRVNPAGDVELKDVGSANGTWKHGTDRIVTDQPVHESWYQMGKAQVLFQSEP